MAGQAGRSGPPGNQNGAKSRLFEQAFIRELKLRDIEAGDGETLRKIVGKILDNALDGDVISFREARDTVDGKPHQSVDATIDANVTVNVVRFADDPSPS